MITCFIWTIWTLLSAVRESPLNSITQSLTHSLTSVFKAWMIDYIPYKIVDGITYNDKGPWSLRGCAQTDIHFECTCETDRYKSDVDAHGNCDSNLRIQGSNQLIVIYNIMNIAYIIYQIILVEPLKVKSFAYFLARKMVICKLQD